MAGTHYVRALRGLIIISEVIDIMRWEAFWLSRNREDYEVVLKPLDTCKKALQEKNPNEAKKHIDDCLPLLEPLKREFEEFCQESSTKSEQCRYLLILRNFEVLNLS